MAGLVGVVVLIILIGFTVYLYGRRTDRAMEDRHRFYEALVDNLKSEVSSLHLLLNRMKSKLSQYEQEKEDHAKTKGKDA